jgi:hypothetical protein
VNFVWPAQTKLACKNYFSNNLQEVKWVIWIFSAKKKKEEFLWFCEFLENIFIQGICIWIISACIF